ncbi:hypothetical protein J5N97_005690 [Dioscorea zingiberensis]|uniref:Uncharacterized protein n=1 Tax=Dioscorea zingiberensis TaxID=325984 RepID=A0A9D5HSI8_9LILI|nr:hypothetical protein J5N97_005690 [Dioscorea zingiberensis]
MEGVPTENLNGQISKAVGPGQVTRNSNSRISTRRGRGRGSSSGSGFERGEPGFGFGFESEYHESNSDLEHIRHTGHKEGLENIFNSETTVALRHQKPAPQDKISADRHQWRGRGGMVYRDPGRGKLSIEGGLKKGDGDNQEAGEWGGGKIKLLSSISQKDRIWEGGTSDDSLALVLSDGSHHQSLVKKVAGLLDGKMREAQGKDELMEEPPDPGEGTDLMDSQDLKTDLNSKREANAEVHTHKKGRIDMGEPQQPKMV